MRKILVVGIGAGHPEQITIQAINALNRADTLFIPRKGDSKAELADLRREIVGRYVTSPTSRVVEFDVPVRDADKPVYAAGIGDWHQAVAAVYAELIGELADDGTGALLIWGDPSLFDGTLRTLDRVRAGGMAFDIEVIPGVSSLHALTAAHRTALNRTGEPVLVTTGRQLAAMSPAGDAVVMLDSRLAFNNVDGDAYDIFWGAYLGTPDEILISGRLADVAPEIERQRAEARERHGWIMDIYLLRRRGETPDE